MRKVILILIVILIVCASNCNVLFAQPTQLTDRELLIQLFGKMESIEHSINRIENSFTGIKENAQELDKRVTKSEMNIANFWEKLEDLMLRWNTLLGLFVTFVGGIFIWMWRSVYYRHHSASEKVSKVH